MKQRPAETEEVVDLTPEEIAELDERVAAVERGEFINGDEMLRQLAALREARKVETESASERS